MGGGPPGSTSARGRARTGANCTEAAAPSESVITMPVLPQLSVRPPIHSRRGAVPVMRPEVVCHQRHRGQGAGNRSCVAGTIWTNPAICSLALPRGLYLVDVQGDRAHLQVEQRLYPAPHLGLHLAG
jgi:hypothetical protein